MDAAHKKSFACMMMKIFNFAFTFLGCLLTLILIALGVNGVFASAFMGLLLAGLAVVIGNNTYSEGAFVGTFAGMTSPQLLNYEATNPLSLSFTLNAISLSLVVALIFDFQHQKQSFNGYGGRMGVIAFIAVLLFLFIVGLVNERIPHYINTESLQKISYAELLFVIPALMGSIVTAVLNRSNNAADRVNQKVAITSIVALIGEAIFMQTPVYQSLLSLAHYVGTFVGMSSPNLLQSNWSFLMAGILAGLIFIFMHHLFQGIGGTLGVTAFFAVIVVSLYDRNITLRRKSQA